MVEFGRRKQWEMGNLKTKVILYDSLLIKHFFLPMIPFCPVHFGALVRQSKEALLITTWRLLAPLTSRYVPEPFRFPCLIRGWAWRVPALLALLKVRSCQLQKKKSRCRLYTSQKCQYFPCILSVRTLREWEVLVSIPAVLGSKLQRSTDGQNWRSLKRIAYRLIRKQRPDVYQVQIRSISLKQVVNIKISFRKHLCLWCTWGTRKKRYRKEWAQKSVTQPL